MAMAKAIPSTTSMCFSINSMIWIHNGLTVGKGAEEVQVVSNAERQQEDEDEEQADEELGD
ncbi:hypothetical protein EYF80_039121 [Liparis tanakae]|uniref:Uncharacterized protein n=1 Tax=Liparis tanakae TaxID=230148 RepID=A0A4Z2GBS7_9TELE|nr:hypothetical protein EYF80_039121 [Liparis tanakae]